MKKLSVVIIGSAWPLRGGLAAFNERLATEFQREGYTVSIETFSLQYPGFLFPGKSQYADWKAPEHLDIKVSVNSINPFNWVRTGRKIRRSGPDLVIFKYWLPFMGPCFGTIARKIKKSRHSRVVTILDNIIPHEKRPGDRIFTKYFIKPVDAFVAMSDSVLNDTLQFNNTKPRKLCPHPLYDNFGEKVKKEDAINHLNLDSKMHYILFFGFIRDYKGLDLLIRAFADERIRNSKLRLLVAGEFYTDDTPYQELIDQNGLRDHIILRTDFIPDDEVKYYFSAADLVAQPYKSATQSGISQIAYHFDRPMIVTNVGGLPEMVPDGKVGFVVERDPSAIADAVQRFYSADLEQEFSANCAKEKQNYSWKRMVGTIEELYQKIEENDHKK